PLLVPGDDLERARRVPRRLPARRPGHPAGDRRGRAPRVGRRADPRSPAAALGRAPFLQHLSLALPDLLRDAAGPRRTAPRLAVAHAAAGADARRGRALVPLRRDADPERRNRAVPLAP